MGKLYLYQPDTEHEPAARDEDCLNCNRKWDLHDGWACGENIYNQPKSKIPTDKQYLTSDMQQQTPTPVSIQPVVKPDLSDWKVWRDQGTEPGHCVCRIPRTTCSYHK
jgi:hypothetical protein